MKNHDYIIIAVLISMTIFIGCDLSDNYSQQQGPVYQGSYLTEHPESPTDTLTIVSYNIKYAHEVEKAGDILRHHPVLKDADIYLLQEMENAGVDSLARILQCDYLYYPATDHIMAGHDFGNAILSKWPLDAPEKLILPHLNPLNKSIRIAALGTVHIGNDSLRVVSLHLETPLLQQSKKKDQITTVLTELSQGYDGIIIGGDFNTANSASIDFMNKLLSSAGFSQATRDINFTARSSLLTFLQFKLDHIYIKNLKLIEAGKVVDFSASDHLPLWIRVGL